MMVALPHDNYAGTITPDADLRQTLLGNEVMRHPAKQHIPQLLPLLRRFGVPGGVLLDPFGGSGTSMLGAAPSHGGMYVITVELAQHFHAMQQRAWEHFRCSIDMQDCYDIPPGDYWPMLGDSRDLIGTFAANVVEGYGDTVITSPPYQDAVNHERRRQHDARRLLEGKIPDSTLSHLSRNSMMTMGGYAPAVDTIITSPPYQDSLTDGNPKRKPQQVFKVLDKQAVSRIMPAYDLTTENIGNLRGGKYISSMAQVWAGCAAVLRPGGILCCITRDCVRDGKIVSVGQQNRDLLTAAGLELIDIERWHVDRLSFWRIVQKRKNPNAPIIDTEEVSIYRKPEARS